MQCVACVALVVVNTHTVLRLRGCESCRFDRWGRLGGRGYQGCQVGFRSCSFDGVNSWLRSDVQALA
jgi:hypothetical protein